MIYIHLELEMYYECYNIYFKPLSTTVWGCCDYVSHKLVVEMMFEVFTRSKIVI